MKRGRALGALLAAAVTAAAAAEAYTYPSYDTVVKRLHALEAAHPGLVKVWDGQSQYRLPTAGACTVDGRASPCKHWFVRVTNEATLPAEPSRPQVFFSGNLHGNEKVGPPTLLALVERLAASAALARSAGGTPSPTSGDAWLARLVDTRVIVALVVSNPVGYTRGVRHELGVDPNRDFPHDVAPSACMKTVVARAVNEVFRAHLFQSGITFHGGMQAVSYEWGAYNHRGANSHSPDEATLAALGHAMADWAGAYPTAKYPVSQMNNVVYAVHGGMEDWAYAGSWDGAARVQCRPSTNGGYSAERTKYADATLRCAMVLVETADAKTPSTKSLGTSAALLQHQGPGDGHVPRNLRVALVTVDTVEPYVAPLRVNGQRADVPTTLPTAGGGSVAVAAHLMAPPSGLLPVTVAFDVGGGWAVGAHGLALLALDSIADVHWLAAAARGVGGVAGAGAAPAAAPPTGLGEWAEFVAGARAWNGSAGTPGLGAGATALLVSAATASGPLGTRWAQVAGTRAEVESREDLEASAFHERITLTASLAAPASPAAGCALHAFVALPWAVVDASMSGPAQGSVDPAGALPQTHMARVRGNGRYRAAVSVPAQYAEDGAAVQWTVRGQAQAVGQPLLLAVQAGAGTGCVLVGGGGGGSGRREPPPGDATGDHGRPEPVLPSVTPSPRHKAKTGGGDPVAKDVGGTGVPLALGVLAALLLLGGGAACFAHWRARAQADRYAAAHARVGGAAPSFSDALPGRVAPPVGDGGEGGVAEVVLSPALPPQDGGASPPPLGHLDDSDGDLEDVARLLHAGRDH